MLKPGSLGENENKLHQNVKEVGKEFALNNLKQYTPKMLDAKDLSNFHTDTIPSKMEWLPDIEIAIHPAENNVIIINYPGVLWDINGYADKYLKLAAFIQKNIGTAVRISGPDDLGNMDLYQRGIQAKLRQTIQYMLENKKDWEQKQEEKIIYLVWFSAGASGIAAMAWEFPQVKKILLMAPAGDVWEENVQKWLKEYTWELYTINGEADMVVGPDSWKIFSQYAKKASLIKNVIIPNCDHQFRWEENSKVMSSAPLRAFLDEQEFTNTEKPDTQYGIKLYD